MKKSIDIGVVCFARKTFDFKAAKEIFENDIIPNLREVENVNWLIEPNLIFDAEEARETANFFSTENLDGLVIICGTFHLGHLILEMISKIKKPLLLWALPELPYDGGKIRLNSVCGLNLDSSILYKSGIKNYHYVIGKEIDNDWLDALRIIDTLSSAKIGIIGSHASGFFNLDFDESVLFENTGVTVEHFSLHQLLDEEINPKFYAQYKEFIEIKFNLDDINDNQIVKVAELSAKLKSFYERNNLSALTIRCWPEFAADYGISPCGSMSVVQSEDMIIACEGDVIGAMSMLAHSAIGAETPYFADFSQIDFANEFALLWHCGVAPCNLWDGQCQCTLDTYFAGGKGITAGFVMKSGPISIMRIDLVGTQFRIFLQEGEAVPMEKQLKGTYIKAVFKEPIRQVIDKIISNGIVHHTSVVYGNFSRPFEILAKIKEWKVIQ